MDITYCYSKKRDSFGRQPMFSETPVEMIDSIESDVEIQKKFGLRNPVTRDCQVSTSQSEHYVNTKIIPTKMDGMNHVEGGWAKEINYLDEETTTRYRRRIERDDAYVDAILHKYPKFVHYIKQNNAIEMYQMYFRGMPEESAVEKSSVVLKNIFRDEKKRPVSSLAWTCEDDPKLIVSYCDTTFPQPNVKPHNVYYYCDVWNLENPNIPVVSFDPPTPCWKLVCSPASPDIVVAGLEDGRVCIFDLRFKSVVYHDPVAICPIHLAHRDPVNALVYINSRLNNEFFSGSTDGQCMWWDVRDISQPLETLPMSVRIPPGEQPNLGNAHPVSALQYDKSFPTRFLCGTDTGLVVNVNRKGKSQQEIMSSIFYAHYGPVKAVHRSPVSSKVFITCGDWRVNIWSDDVLTSPIISGTARRSQVNDVAWAPERFSGYMCISADGKLRYWDLLRKYREPLVTHAVAKVPLLKLLPQEEGRFIAIGDKGGSTHLLQLSDNLVFSGEKDKQLMLQSYDRENRREHILEARIKEIRLKQRVDEETEVVEEVVIDEEALIKTAEEEYKKAVLDEMRAAGVTTQKSGTQMRKR